MSYAAQDWVLNLPGADLTNAEFRILMHLCKCHNPAKGCFPSQAYLRDACDLSHSGLNKALRALEQKGLIRRIRMQNARTKRREPTRYLLGFEIGEVEAQTPPEPPRQLHAGGHGETCGQPQSQVHQRTHGNGEKPPPSHVHQSALGAMCTSGPEPCALCGPSHVHQRTQGISKEKINKTRARTRTRGDHWFFTAGERQTAEQLAREIDEAVDAGETIDIGWVSPRVMACIRLENMLSAATVAALRLGHEQEHG